MGNFQDKIEYLITAKVDEAIKNIKKLEDQNKRNEKTTTSMFSKMKAGWLVAGALVGGAVGSMVKKVIGLAAAYEQTKVAFNTFLGSAKKGKQILSQLEKFSIVTPFTINQVLNAGKKLLAFGVSGDKVKDTLKLLGDVSAGTGKDLGEMSAIFGKILQNGKLMGGELNQLIDAGFNPLNEISKKTGKSIVELKDDMAKGLISFDMVEDAFKDATGEGGLFFNMMQKQSATFSGRLSTLQGNLAIVGRSIGNKLLPVMGFFVDKLDAMIKPQRDLATATDDLTKHTASYEIVLKKLNSETLEAGSNEERLLKVRKGQLELDIAKDIDRINDAWIKHNVTQGVSLSKIDKIRQAEKLLQQQFNTLTDALDSNDKSTKVLGGSLVRGGGQVLTYAQRQKEAASKALSLKSASNELAEALSKQKEDLDKVTGAYLDSTDKGNFLKILNDNLRIAVLGNVDAFNKEAAALAKLNKEKNKPPPKPKGGGGTVADPDFGGHAGFQNAMDNINTVSDARKEAALAAVQLASDMFGSINALQKQSTQQAIDEITREADSRKANLESRKELDAIAKEEQLEEITELTEARDNATERGNENDIKDTQRALDKVVLSKKLAEKEKAIEDDKQKKIRAEKRKSAIADKAFGILQAGISTGIGMARAFADHPFPFSAIISGLVGGLGIVQTAAIASKPIPAFATGGSLITDGPQLFLAGDNGSGREQIDITPLGDEGGASGNSYNFYGVEDLSGARNELMRLEGVDAWQS